MKTRLEAMARTKRARLFSERRKSQLCPSETPPSSSSFPSDTLISHPRKNKPHSINAGAGVLRSSNIHASNETVQRLQPAKQHRGQHFPFPQQTKKTPGAPTEPDKQRHPPINVLPALGQYTTKPHQSRFPLHTTTSPEKERSRLQCNIHLSSRSVNMQTRSKARGGGSNPLPPPRPLVRPRVSPLSRIKGKDSECHRARKAGPRLGPPYVPGAARCRAAPGFRTWSDGRLRLCGGTWAR